MVKLKWITQVVLKKCDILQSTR